jgi:hypothetical protein
MAPFLPQSCFYSILLALWGQLGFDSPADKTVSVSAQENFTALWIILKKLTMNTLRLFFINTIFFCLLTIE